VFPVSETVLCCVAVRGSQFSMIFEPAVAAMEYVMQRMEHRDQMAPSMCDLTLFPECILFAYLLLAFH